MKKANAPVVDVRRILGEIKASNKIFTVRFIKKNGEERVMNAVPVVHKHVKGTGTAKQTSTYKYQTHDLFQCYEVKITNEEKELMADQDITEEKVIGFKSVFVPNIKEIRVGGQVYKF